MCRLQSQHLPVGWLTRCTVLSFDERKRFIDKEETLMCPCKSASEVKERDMQLRDC